MKTTCKRTKINKEELEEDKTVLREEFDYKMFGLEMERKYLVMGMLTYPDTSCVYYLTDIDDKPTFFPYFLFEISDNKLPSNWHVKVFGKNNPNAHTICGFRELCEEGFYEQLMEQEDEAMMTYFRRRIEREKELEELKWLSN